MTITIDKQPNGAMKIGFSEDYNGDPVSDLERAKFAILIQDTQSRIKKPSPIQTAKLVGVK